jgi:hypothetical protein
MWIERDRFIYRHNPDDTIDAFCTACMKIICSVCTLAAAMEAETNHTCQALNPHLPKAQVKLQIRLFSTFISHNETRDGN